MSSNKSSLPGLDREPTDDRLATSTSTRYSVVCVKFCKSDRAHGLNFGCGAASRPRQTGCRGLIPSMNLAVISNNIREKPLKMCEND
jgi:hypothetical protein